MKKLDQGARVILRKGDHKPTVYCALAACWSKDTVLSHVHSKPRVGTVSSTWQERKAGLCRRGCSPQISR